jgi:hypothetical protein
VPVIPEGSAILVSPEGVATDPEKLEAVKFGCNRHTPLEELTLRKYYRFVPVFPDLAKPSTQLTEGKRPFHWSPQAGTAFQSLKDELCTTPVLGYPQSREKFIVDTHARNFGIGVA